MIFRLLQIQQKKNGLKNYIEDISKFRMGQLSAGSSPNNDIIIPILPLRGSVGNLTSVTNFGNTNDNNINN